MLKRKVTVLFIVVMLLAALLAVPQRAIAGTGVGGRVADTDAGDSSFVEVIGSVYEFDKKSNYEIADTTDYVQTRHDNTYGKFSVQADFAGIREQDEMLQIGAQGKTVGFYYSYGDGALYDDTKSGEWVLTKDTGKKIDDMKLGAKIGKGTIIIQSSADGETWNTVLEQTDAFEETPYRAHPIYSTTTERLAEGCYYRIIVVYKEQKFLETKKVLFFDVDKYEYRKKAEVYEFYLYEVNLDEEILENMEEPVASGAAIMEEATAEDASDVTADAAANAKSSVGWMIAMIAIVVLAIAAIVIVVVKRLKKRQQER